jgi:hypothetical protein
MHINNSSGELEKTTLWTSTLNTEPVQLMDVFAKNRFQNYARTIHRLKAKILYDGYIKPFAVFKDDNLLVGGVPANFILQSYTWDLNYGTYEIDAQEYTDEDLGFDYAQDPGHVRFLVAPTGLDGIQAVPGEGLDISWNSVTGATSYILQRQPYYDGLNRVWVNNWKTVWEGPQTTFYDDLQREGTTPNTLHVMYQVMAKNTALNSPYSSSFTIFWYLY